MTGQLSIADRGGVAIVGIGCRFPGGVTDPATFWALLSEGTDAIAEIPASRIDLGHYFDARPATPGRMMTRWGGFLNGIEDFDADFFGISPREAERLDPQQRLLLETAWEALEDAGQDVQRLEGSNTGVFVGQWLSDFESRLFADPEGVDFYMTTGSGRYASSGRLSYALGFRGPSLTLDTACSSSLTAVHLAARSVRSGECSLAIAGGVNIILQPHISIAYSQSRMMAPDGRCKFGDARGDGYVRSEGAGLIVLKPLHRALIDGDRVYAVIRGSAVNNDGRSSGSMGTPSRVGQEELLRTAYRDAGRSAGEVSYIEAHGTGTRAGDPVELGALGAVLGDGRAAGHQACVGSVKTNLGHTEGAAGVAGLIKVALALHHDAIPPSLHCLEPNPAIPWAELPFEVACTRRPWPASTGARLAGVSAFGIAGTNAHVVLEGAPAVVPGCVATSQRSFSLLPLSARSDAALRVLALRYADQLKAGFLLADVCWSAATRRTPLETRAAFVATDALSMADALRRFASGEAAAAEGVAYTSERPRIAFVCPGQGAQWQGMARALMEHEPVFRSAVQQCDQAAQAHVDWSIVEQLAADPGSPGYQLERIDVIQPVLVALAYAYAALWRSFGVVPNAVVGHSMGEVAAACVAGVLDLDQAMRIICRRSALMFRTSGQGAMALVELSMADAQSLLAGREHEVSVAVSNSPRSSVISGTPNAVHSLIAELERENVFCRLVKVDVASHSPQMEPLAAELASELTDMSPHSASVALYSTVLGRRADDTEFGAEYWAANLRQPVRFGTTVERMLADGISVFIELGPHPVLLPSVQQTAQALSKDVTTIACARREDPEQASLLAAVGALHCAGYALDWALVTPEGGRFVSLPTYPWQRERHWIASADMVAAGTRGDARTVATGHPVLGNGIELAGAPVGAVWALAIDPTRVPAWFEHGLHGSTVLPASAYLEMALAAARALAPACGIRNLSFERALHLQVDAASALQLCAGPDARGGLHLEFQGHADVGWVRHAHADFGVTGDAEASLIDIAAVARLRQQPALAGSEVYARLNALGVGFGPSLRSIAQAWLAPGEALARLESEAASDGQGDRFCMEPAMLDACFQLMVMLAPENELWLPTKLASARALRQPVGAVWVHALAASQPDQDDILLVDACMFDAQGPVLTLRGLALRRLGSSAAADARASFYSVRWVAASASASASAPAAGAVRQWLLVADRGGVAETLATLLVQQGDAVNLSRDPSGIDALLEKLLRDSRPGLRTELVDLRALDLADVGSAFSETTHALVQTAQALGRLPHGGAARLWWVTRGARDAQPGDAATLNLAQAPLWGLGAVVAVEQGDRWGGNIDLDPRASDAGAAAALLQTVMAEAGSTVLRGNQRFQARLQRLDVGANLSAPIWRKDASYLLTGGLGGVGVQVARWLVGAGVRHLVVMGRTPLPPRAQWASIDAASPAGRAVAAVKQIESLGASVRHAAVDVADAAALREWLVQFTAEDRPVIRGVLHAAGVTEDKLVRDLDAASLAAVLRPKLQGGLNLHELLPELDAFVLFSSMAAVLPQAGQASYAAANAFLDALAAQRRAQGQHALSIGWGAWAQTGVMQGEVGRRQLAELMRQGIGSFSPSQAVSLLGPAFLQGASHLVVMPVDWAVLRQSRVGSTAALAQDLFDEAASTASATVQATGQNNAPADPIERRRALERAVRDVVGRVLKLVPARIDARKPLGSMGLTSLMALELRNRLEPLHGKPLSATLAWNYPTVDALVNFLSGSDESAPGAASVPVPPATGPSTQAEVAAVLSGVNELSDEDAVRMLRKRR